MKKRESGSGGSAAKSMTLNGGNTIHTMETSVSGIHKEIYHCISPPHKKTKKKIKQTKQKKHERLTSDTEWSNNPTTSVSQV